MESHQRRHAHRALAFATAAAVSVLLAACAPAGGGEASPGAEDDLGQLNVQLSWILNEAFAGEYFAETRGYYEDAGLSSVHLIPGPSGGAAELLSGTADVAKSDAATIGAAVANESAPLKIIGATLQSNPFTILSLADGADIETPEDLIGTRIGVQDKNVPLFQALLSANDIAASDVEVVPIQYDTSPLVNGDVDGVTAFVTNESIAVAAQGVPVTNLLFAENGLPFVAEAFVVTDSYLASNREKLKAFLAAEIRGWTDAVGDPEEGARLAVEEFGSTLELDPEASLAGSIAQTELIRSEGTDRDGLFTIDDGLQEATVESLARAGIELTTSQLFDMSLLAEVYAENPDLVTPPR